MVQNNSIPLHTHTIQGYIEVVMNLNSYFYLKFNINMKSNYVLDKHYSFLQVRQKDIKHAINVIITRNMV